MNWFSKFLTSSIGRKLIMSLTGLFLVLFLVVHLIGNVQLLFDDGGKSFNIYADMMANNPLIKFVSIGLYLFILLHTVQGLLLWSKNKNAKGQGYAVTNNANTSWASKNMAMLGILIFAFLCIHMGDFWFKMKFTNDLGMTNYADMDHQVRNLYIKVYESFSTWWIVLIYIIGVLALAIHLRHGFQSAFQTLGLNHKKYTPLIHTIGNLYSFLIPLGFIIIPIIYFGDAQGWWNWFSH